jgi:hypothetical protein
MINLGGVGVQKAKVEAILQIPQPINVSQLRIFLGLCNIIEDLLKDLIAFLNI